MTNSAFEWQAWEILLVGGGALFVIAIRLAIARWIDHDLGPKRMQIARGKA